MTKNNCFQRSHFNFRMYFILFGRGNLNLNLKVIFRNIEVRDKNSSYDEIATRPLIK